MLLCSCMADDTKYLLALNRHPFLGAKRLLALKKAYGDWQRVWGSTEKERESNVGDKTAKAVSEARTRYSPEHELEIISKLNINVVELGDVNYPTALKEVSDPPALLYYKGSLDALSGKVVAVVGSRSATQYGYRATEDIFLPIARLGVTIVSGLALGIDTVAHRVALNGGGKTVAVLGCGMDRIYPVSNTGLARAIVEKGGALISEFAPGLPSFRSNFPQRNRIIAALAQLTVVVEGLAESGALITARAALEYNKEVGAVPGDINRPQSAGPLNLIKMGALPVTCADDVTLALGLVPPKSVPVSEEGIKMTSEEKTVYNVLSHKPEHIDKIVSCANLNIAQVNSSLTILEIKGLVKNLGGNLFVRR